MKKAVSLALITGVSHFGLIWASTGWLEFAFHAAGVALTVILLFSFVEYQDIRARYFELKDRSDKRESDYFSLKENLKSHYEGLSIHAVARKCGKPESVHIGRDDLPHKLDDDGNDEYLFWASLTGDLYHSRRKCHPAVVYPCNAADVRDRKPCPRCKPVLPDLAWHEEYRAVLRDFERCGLPRPRPHIDGEDV